jgi:hypothetical protein
LSKWLPSNVKSWTVAVPPQAPTKIDVLAQLVNELFRTTTWSPAPNCRHSTCALGCVRLVKSWKRTPSIRTLCGTAAPCVSTARICGSTPSDGPTLPPRIAMSDALSTKNHGVVPRVTVMWPESW